jgi:undecaprenyl-diphosphatase
MEWSWASLSSLDQELFLFLNGMHHPVSDFLFKWITYKYTWLPLYGYLFYLVFKSFKREGIIMIVLSLVALIVADYVTSGIMKPYYARFRPCHDPVIGHWVHNVVGCGGQYGFASSHASTSFALATGLYLFAGRTLPGFKWLFVWATVYAYSRVAVGVHYPGDILVGALTGILTALIIAYSYFYFRKTLV